MEQAISDKSADSEPARNESWRMFNRISGSYDLVNRLLSFGIDVRWRKRIARHLPGGEALHVLDLATGTADQLLHLSAASHRMGKGIGMDLADGMLEVGRKKVGDRGLAEKISLEVGDATNIPADAGQFDATTISFGIRNVPDVSAALREMRRVLKPGGRALILEFSLPRNRLIRALHLFYLRRVLPRVGGIVSGDTEAYRYLNRTIEAFPYGDAFCDLMREAGFERVQATPLTFGVATIYQGDKM